jgi:hypothetical protein
MDLQRDVWGLTWTQKLGDGAETGMEAEKVSTASGGRNATRRVRCHDDLASTREALKTAEWDALHDSNHRALL